MFSQRIKGFGRLKILIVCGSKGDRGASTANADGGSFAVQKAICTDELKLPIMGSEEKEKPLHGDCTM